MLLLDLALFSQHINARASSNETLAQFYADRFRDEAKVAFAAWMATRPFENPDAPAKPFVTNFYQPRLLAEAGLAETESERWGEAAGEAGRTGRSYVLVTVLLAVALFCEGTSSKFEKPWVCRATLALGMGALLFAITRLLMLPAQL